MSTAIENFVKVIYLNEQNQGFDTRPGTIARALGISSAAATDMSRKLAEKQLVYYEKYQQLRLTEHGKKMALHVIRKHRLWEAFLYRVFHLSLHEIHREAELLEHQTSDFMAEKISEFLGDPGLDPHGEPIPDSHGAIDQPAGQLVLSFVPAGKKYEISGLVSSDKEFFDFCNSNKIHIGTKLMVLNQYDKIKMTEIRTGNRKILLSRDFANIIYVKQMS